MSFSYALFGLSITAHKPLPELDSEQAKAPADLTLEAESIDAFAHLLDAAGEGMAASYREDSFAAWMPGIGGLSVRRGRIGVHLASADWDLMRPYLLGMGLAVAMYQLRVFPHHVSAVAVGDYAVAFTGASGAGKSTFAYQWLSQFDAELVSDDLARIDPSGSQPLIYPGLARVKLWSDALRGFSIANEGLSQELRGRDKFFLENVRRVARPVPLRALVLLESEPELGEPRVERLSGAQRVIAARSSLYRPEFATMLYPEAVLTRELLTLCAALPIYRLVRPRRLELLSEGARLLHNRLLVDGVWAEPDGLANGEPRASG